MHLVRVSCQALAVITNSVMCLLLRCGVTFTFHIFEQALTCLSSVLLLLCPRHTVRMLTVQLLCQNFTLEFPQIRRVALHNENTPSLGDPRVTPRIFWCFYVSAVTFAAIESRMQSRNTRRLAESPPVASACQHHVLHRMSRDLTFPWSTRGTFWSTFRNCLRRETFHSCVFFLDSFDHSLYNSPKNVAATT